MVRGLVYFVAAILALPAWAEPDRDRRHRAPRDDAGLFQRHRGEGRHDPRLNLWLFSAPVVPGSMPFRPRGVQWAAPVWPNAQFSYYCNNPAGYFPTVSTCRGAWLETGALSPQ